MWTKTTSFIIYTKRSLRVLTHVRAHFNLKFGKITVTPNKGLIQWCSIRGQFQRNVFGKIIFIFPRIFLEFLLNFSHKNILTPHIFELRACGILRHSLYFPQFTPLLSFTEQLPYSTCSLYVSMLKTWNHKVIFIWIQFLFLAPLK